MIRSFAALLALVVLAHGTVAHGQLRRETEPVMLPPLSLSAPDGPYALAANPAALTGLTGWNLAYVHASGPNDDEAQDRGDAGYAAMPLPLGFAAALSIEHTRGGRPFGPATHVAVGGAWGPSPRLALGFAVRHIEGGSVDGATTWDLAMLVRRSRRFAFSLLGQDLLGPAKRVGLDGLSVPATVLMAYSVRPHGDDFLTLEGFAGIATDGRVGFGGYGGVGLPRGGRVVARATIEHFRYQAELRVLAGAEVPWDRFTALGGVVVGDGYQGATGWYAGAVVGERAAMSLPGPKFVAELFVEGTVDAYRILELVEALQRATHDPRVGAVLVRFDDATIALAYAEELGQAVATLRSADKPVICYLGSHGTPELVACAAAERTLIAPTAGIHLREPHAEISEAGGALTEASIEVDLVARGVRAPDAYAGDEAQIDADLGARLRADLSRALGVPPGEVTALVTSGELGARDAVRTPLADGTAHLDELDDALEEVIDFRPRRRTRLGPFGPRAWARPRRVAVVVVDGAILDDARGEALAGEIERLAENRAVGAIVLRVDSAGGSLVAVERVREALAAARGKKSLVASLGAEATSGAYLLASACDEIVASPATITGGLALAFGRVAESGGRVRPFTPDERVELARRLLAAERSMNDEVRERRSLTDVHAERVASGRFVSGDEGLRLGLVDRLGGFASAVARARELGRVAPSVALSITPPPAADPPPLGDDALDRRARSFAHAIAGLERETALAVAPALVVVP